MNGVDRSTVHAGLVPLALDQRCDVASALAEMRRREQAVAFVRGDGDLLGAVTVEDLQFAWDWRGPLATVGEATSLRLIEVAPGSEPEAAARAFTDGLHRWLRTALGPIAR